MTTTEIITYRLYQDSDLPGVLNLWEYHSSWGAISAETYKEWNFGGPCGNNLIVIAENECGEIVGQGVLAPAKLWLDGKEVIALRITAPILHETVRQQNIRRKDHPAVQLITFLFEAAWEQGYELIYALPALGWVPMLKMLPLFGLPHGGVTTFGCFCIPLDTLLPQQDPELKVQKASGTFDNCYDALWQEAVAGLPVSVGVVRSKEWLTWKISSCHVFEVFRKDQFIGYAAIDKKGLLVDILAQTHPELQHVLVAVQRYLHAYPDLLPGISGLDGMLTPVMEGVLQNIPYSTKNYEFAFGYYPNINKLSPDLLQIPNWYIMPND